MLACSQDCFVLLVLLVILLLLLAFLSMSLGQVWMHDCGLTELANAGRTPKNGQGRWTCLTFWWLLSPDFTWTLRKDFSKIIPSKDMSQALATLVVMATILRLLY